MRIAPTHDNVLVEVYKEEEKKIGSIITVDSEERPYERGKVLAIGPGVADKDSMAILVSSLEVGQEVYFPRGSGCGSPFGRLLKDKDILAVIEE